MKHLLSSVAVAGLLVGLGGMAPAFAIDPSRIENADKNPNDWLTYHGSYKSWHYSGLDQINTDNVKNLEVAWINTPGRATRGLQSFPLVADGVLYYTGSYSRVQALDAATGEMIWAYHPELNEDLIAQQTHTPYTRGIALGHGHVYVGTIDGRLSLPVAEDNLAQHPLFAPADVVLATPRERRLRLGRNRRLRMDGDDLGVARPREEDGLDQQRDRSSGDERPRFPAYSAHRDRKMKAAHAMSPFVVMRFSNGAGRFGWFAEGLAAFSMKDFKSNECARPIGASPDTIGRKGRGW